MYKKIISSPLHRDNWSTSRCQIIHTSCGYVSVTSCHSRCYWFLLSIKWCNFLVWLNPYSAKGLGYQVYATLHKLPGKSATHFVYFLNRKTLPYLEATSYIPQQGQSLHIWTTSLSTTGCYKNKYTIQFLWMVCISRFSAAISSSETELALGTVRVKEYLGTAKHSLLYEQPL